jgi:hypothetical protein
MMAWKVPGIDDLTPNSRSVREFRLMDITTLFPEELRRAVRLKEELDGLTSELASLLGDSGRAGDRVCRPGRGERAQGQPPEDKANFILTFFGPKPNFIQGFYGQ